MRANKFSIGVLIGVQVSIIVNEVIRTISRQCIFFTKKFWVRKSANQTKTNQQNKTKRGKNNKNFSCIKTPKRGEIGYFAFLKKN